MNLELMALRWLLYEKRCVFALRERSPRMHFTGRPDALGVTASRYLIEIEIKRSLSDFRADRMKNSRRDTVRESIGNQLPRQFYYLVPTELVAVVEPIVPEWAGLLDSYHGAIRVAKSAPVNRESRRLSVKECIRFVRMVANWAMSEAESRQAEYLRFRDGAWSWPEPLYEI